MLASLLSLPLRLLDTYNGSPTDLWLAAQARYSGALPKPLRRPHNWLARLYMTADRHLQQSRLRALEDLVPQCAVLCRAHRGLNPWIVRRAFFLVAREATTGTDALRRYLAHPGRYRRHAKKLDADAVGEMRALVDRLAGVVALWMDPAAVGRILGACGRGGGGVTRMPRIRSECEACIIAAVGAHAQTLCDLRAGLLGRTHRGRRSSSRRRREPVLLRLVEAWIVGLDRGGEEVLRQSERLSKVVKRVRRAVHDRKRGIGKRSHVHASQCGRGKAGGSHGQWPSIFPLSSYSVVRSFTSSLLFSVTPSRHHYLGRQSDHAGWLAAVNDIINPRPQVSSYCSSNANTINDIIDAGHGAVRDEDDDGDGHCDDEEFDEADSRAAKQLQDITSRWYDTFSDAHEQHPAFRQSAADIEASWVAAVAEIQVARSAVSTSPRLNVDQTANAPRMPFSDDFDLKDEDSDLTQWTDVSVPTVAPRPSSNTARGKLSQAQTVPRVPSVRRAPFVMSLVGSSANDSTSSLYSQDGTAMAHPSASAVFRPELRPVMSDNEFVNPRAVPPIPTQRDQREMPDALTSTAAFQATARLGPKSHHHHQVTAAPSSYNRYPHTPCSSSSSSASSSSTSRRPARANAASAVSSVDEQWSGLHRLSLDDSVCCCSSGGSHGPEGTVLPDESVSVVGGLRPSYLRGRGASAAERWAEAVAVATAAAGAHVRERGGEQPQQR